MQQKATVLQRSFVSMAANRDINTIRGNKMTAELSFEELPDGSKIITIKGINQFGEKYIRQDRIKCPSVWDALKRLTYTAEEIQDFAEWCSKNAELVADNEWVVYYGEGNTYKATTAQLREMWEQEGGEK